MKFTEAIANFSVTFREPLSTFTELHRQVRERLADLADVERKLAREAAAEGAAVDWGDGGFKNLLRGKPGPRGGLDASPITMSAYLIAYLCDCPHYEAAARMLEMFYAAPREGACPQTGERRFGPAFAKVLGDAALFNKVVDVGVCAALGAAYLDFGDPEADPWGLKPAPIRSLFTTPTFPYAPPGRYTIAHFYPATVRHVFERIQTVAPRAGRAPRKRRALST